MCLTCILFYLASGLLGLLLGRLFFGTSANDRNLIRESEANKKSFENSLNQLKDIKSENHEKLLLKDAQITQLEEEINSFKTSDTFESEEDYELVISELNDKIAVLEKNLDEKSKTEPISDKKWDDISSRLKKIKKEYLVSQKLIKKLRKENEKLTNAIKDSKTNPDNKIKSLQKKTKAFKRLKSDNKKLRKALKEKSQKLLETVEIRETIDTKKLISLLKKGKLSSVNKKVSRRKSY